MEKGDYFIIFRRHLDFKFYDLYFDKYPVHFMSVPSLTFLLLYRL